MSARVRVNLIFSDMPDLKNIFAEIPSSAGKAEIFEQILQSGSVRIERIISQGQVSPEGYWYDQDEDEWVMVVQGAARIQFDDDSIMELKQGDYHLIPAHKKHRVTYTSSTPVCIWLAVFIREPAV